MIALKVGGQLCKYLSFPDLFVSEMKTLCRQGRVGRAIWNSEGWQRSTVLPGVD